MSKHFKKPKKRASVVHRQAPKYNNNSKAKPGYFKGLGNYDWGAHHVLCCSCFTKIDAGDAQKNAYVEDCLYITRWNINDKPNMIGLPMYGRYVRTNCRNAEPDELPAHDVDHNTTRGYTDEVTDYLNANVWQKFNDRRKKHEDNAENLKAALDSASKFFKGQLVKRGVRGGGNRKCWEARFTHPRKGWSAAKKNSYKQVKKWYAPFSMALIPSRRSPGVDWNDMTDIFAKL